MIVNLAKLKVGDTVFFRCGGSAIISDIGSHENKFYPYRLQFVGGSGFSAGQEGEVYGPKGNGWCRPTIFDIVSVNKPAVKKSQKQTLVEIKDQISMLARKMKN